MAIIAPHGGAITGVAGPVAVTKSVLTTASVEHDALIVARGPGSAAVGVVPFTAVNLGEAYRHHKTIAAWGAGQAVLAACAIPADARGVLSVATPNRAFAKALIEAVGWHLHWNRTPTALP